jgi:hypothetical protein
MLTKVTYSMISGANINVFDKMSAAQIADVQSNTGAVDVSAAVQAAFDEAKSATEVGAKTVFFPDGVYLLSNIDLTSAGGGVVGYRNINVQCSPGAYFTCPDNATDMFDISGQRRMDWVGGQFLKANRVFYAEGSSSPAYCRFYNLRFKPAGSSDIKVCYSAETSIGISFIECQFGWDSVANGIETGVDLIASNNGECNLNRFISCAFMNFKDYGYRQRGSAFRKASNTFVGCWFEDSDGVAIEAGSNSFSLSVTECYFENVGNVSTSPISLNFATQTNIGDCFYAANKIVPSMITANGGTLYLRNNHAFINGFPLVSFTNAVNGQTLIDNSMFDVSGTNPSYKSALFSADSDTSENAITWNIPANSGSLTDDEIFTTDYRESRSIYDGYIRYRSSGVQLVNDLTWYDAALVNIGGTGNTAFRLIAEVETLHQGVAPAGRLIEVWVSRNAGTVTVTSIQNINLGGGLELQVIADGTNAKLQARRNGGLSTGVKPIIQVFQADSDIATRRVSLT